MKKMLSKVMKRAWEIKRQDSRNIFALCLKMAWAEVKGMKELKGTPKQVKWANDIREDAFKFVNGCIENDKKKNKVPGFEGFFDKDIKAYEAFLEHMTKFFDEVEDASVIISNRYDLSAESIMSQVERYKRMFLK